nr:L,D-transpeptidase [Actinomycetota bacterium]
EPEPEPEPVAAPASGSAAGALDAEVVVYDAPSGTATQTFANPTASGAPLTFMVTSTADEWVQVQLPVRPNGSTGWVRSQDVTVFDVDYVLKVSTADNTLDVYLDGALIHSFSVATGTGETPTPLGTYYLTELIAPTNSGYGPYAYGISAFSEVLNEFLGGPGQIGLHGTDDSGSIGQAVSHGCIRLSNADITTLAALLPLGTPIQITG